MPGWWAGVGTQALVILVSHLANPQYVLLLFSATESVCEGKQCYKAREGNAVAFLVLYRPSQLTGHTSSPLCPEQHNTEPYMAIFRTANRGAGRFRVQFWIRVSTKPADHIVWMRGSQSSLLLCGAGCSFCLLEHYCQLSTLRSNWSHLQYCSVVMGRSMSTSHPPTASTINQSLVESREPGFGCFSKPELLPGDGSLKRRFWLFFIELWEVQGESFKRFPQLASFIK